MVYVGLFYVVKEFTDSVCAYIMDAQTSLYGSMQSVVSTTLLAVVESNYCRCIVNKEIVAMMVGSGGVFVSEDNCLVCRAGQSHKTLAIVF